MRKALLILTIVLISLTSQAYDTLDVLAFLACHEQPTHIVTGEPLYCNTWDLDDDDDVDCQDLMILLGQFGE